MLYIDDYLQYKDGIVIMTTPEYKILIISSVYLTGAIQNSPILNLAY